MKNVEERVTELQHFKTLWRACRQNSLARSCLIYGKGLVTALRKIQKHKEPATFFIGTVERAENTTTFCQSVPAFYFQ